jgi:hypothetical protein
MIGGAIERAARCFQGVEHLGPGRRRSSGCLPCQLRFDLLQMFAYEIEMTLFVRVKRRTEPIPFVALVW